LIFFKYQNKNNEKTRSFGNEVARTNDPRREHSLLANSQILQDEARCI